MKFILLSIFFFSFQFSYCSVVRPTHFPQTSFKYSYIPSYSYSFTLPLELSHAAFEKSLQNIKAENPGLKETFEAQYQKEVEQIINKGLIAKAEGAFAGHAIGYEVEVPVRTWLNYGFSVSAKFSLPYGFFASYPGKRIGVELTFFPRFQFPITDFPSFFSSLYLKTAFGLSTNILQTNLPTFSVYGGDEKINVKLNKFAQKHVFRGATARANRKENPIKGSLPVLGLGFPLLVESGLDFYIGQWFSLTLGYSFCWTYLFEFALNYSNDKDLGEFIKGSFGVHAIEHTIQLGIKSTYF